MRISVLSPRAAALAVFTKYKPALSHGLKLRCARHTAGHTSERSRAPEAANAGCNCHCTSTLALACTLACTLACATLRIRTTKRGVSVLTHQPQSKLRRTIERRKCCYGRVEIMRVLRGGRAILARTCYSLVNRATDDTLEIE